MTRIYEHYIGCIDDDEFDTMFFEKVCRNCRLLTMENGEEKCPVNFNFSKDRKCPYHKVWKTAFYGALKLIKEKFENPTEAQ